MRPEWSIVETHWYCNFFYIYISSWLFISISSYLQCFYLYFNGWGTNWDLSVPLWKHIGRVRPLRLLPLLANWEEEPKINMDWNKLFVQLKSTRLFHYERMRKKLGTHCSSPMPIQPYYLHLSRNGRIPHPQLLLIQKLNGNQLERKLGRIVSEGVEDFLSSSNVRARAITNFFNPTVVQNFSSQRTTMTWKRTFGSH